MATTQDIMEQGEHVFAEVRHDTTVSSGMSLREQSGKNSESSKPGSSRCPFAFIANALASLSTQQAHPEGMEPEEPENHATGAVVGISKETQEHQQYLTQTLANWNFSHADSTQSLPVVTPKHVQSPGIVYGAWHLAIENVFKLERRGLWHYWIWWFLMALWNIPLLALPADFDLITTAINVFFVVVTRNELFLLGVYKVIVFVGRLLPPGKGKRFVNRMAYNIGGIHTSAVFFLVLNGYHTLGVSIAQLHLDQSAELKSKIAFLGTFRLLELIIIACAGPWRHNSKSHDCFEFSHRYCGWGIAVLLIAMTAVLVGEAANGGIDGQQVVSSVIFVVSVCFVAWPWVTMKRVQVRIFSPSNMVCLIRWRGRPICAGPGTAIRVSFNFFGQYHPFACLPDVDGAQNVAMVAVATAGDWTKACNQRGAGTGPGGELQYPPTEAREETIYMRRFAAPGFMYLLRTYKRVVAICTGAGIAPVAAYLPTPPNDMLILWVGRDFRQTYGPLLDFVLQHKDTVLVNTKADPDENNPFAPSHEVIVDDEHDMRVLPRDDEAGKFGEKRPNLPQLAMAAVEMYRADAVFVVSGKEPTYEVCYQLWKCGIHAYGATWDS